jgi:hypothetical protein
MRISAQRLYNTATAGDHGLLAFMLECPDTQNYSVDKLVTAASACTDPIARTHTLLVLQVHGMGQGTLNWPVEGMPGARTRLSQWEPMWDEGWNAQLEIRLQTKQPLGSSAWARAALISNLPYEYVLLLCRRASTDSDTSAAQVAASILNWSSYLGYGVKQKHGTVEQVEKWLTYCHEQGIRAADYAWAYVMNRQHLAITSVVLKLADIRRMKVDMNADQLFLLKYADAEGSLLHKFLRGETA